MEEKILKVYLFLVSALCGTGAFYGFRISVRLFSDISSAEEVFVKILLLFGSLFIGLLSVGFIFACAIILWMIFCLRNK